MAEKRSKDSVHYGPGDLDGEHCGACKHFIEPALCELVEGRIRSRDWCRLFVYKRKPRVTKEEDDGVSEKAG